MCSRAKEGLKGFLREETVIFTLRPPLRPRTQGPGTLCAEVLDMEGVWHQSLGIRDRVESPEPRKGATMTLPLK